MNVLEIVTRDCGYGFSGFAVMEDGSRSFHTTRLHASSEQAQEEVSALANKNRPATTPDPDGDGADACSHKTFLFVLELLVEAGHITQAIADQAVKIAAGATTETFPPRQSEAMVPYDTARRLLCDACTAGMAGMGWGKQAEQLFDTITRPPTAIPDGMVVDDPIADAARAYLSASALADAAARDGGNVHGALSGLIGARDNLTSALSDDGDEERCESGAPECGPVEFHDSECVPLCRGCWEQLAIDAAPGSAEGEK